jgi:hypothetical protein
MKFYTLILLTGLAVLLLISCDDQELFKSESTVKKELQGTWDLIPIPLYDTIRYPNNTYTVIKHSESWTFDDTKITMVNNGQTGSSTYSVHTTVSSAEFYIDGITPVLTSPARLPRNNGTWRIVSMDDDFLKIGSDQDGVTGLTQLEFEKR